MHLKVIEGNTLPSKYSTEKWQDSKKFNSDCRIVHKNGRDYELFAKKTRQVSYAERLIKIFTGCILVLTTLGLGLRSKKIRNLFSPTSTVRFARLCSDGKKEPDIKKIDNKEKEDKKILNLSKEENAILINSLKYVESNDSKGFKDIFLTLSKKNDFKTAANVAKKLLENCIPDLLQPTPYREKYEFILNNLKEVYPFLNQYFARMEAGNGLNKVAISTKGIRNLISQMSSKDNLVVCDNYGNFESKFNELCKSNDPQQKTFLLRHRQDKKKNTNHTTAIKVIKRKSEISVYFADSTGGVNPKGDRNSWTKLMIAAIKRQHQASNCQTPLNIYYYNGPSRQTDHTNCAIYALRDASYMSRNSDELIKWVKENGQPQQLEKNVIGVPLLPPQLMKTKQSLSAITRYLDTPLNNVNLGTLKLPSNKYPNGETLEENLLRHTRILETPEKQIRINTKVRMSEILTWTILLTNKKTVV